MNEKKIQIKNSEITLMDEAKIALNPGLFLENEHKRLTGKWFTPLPCHWWQLEPGIEIELKFKDGKFSNYKDYFEYFDDRGVLRFRNAMFHIGFIKLIRIVSYEVK